MNDSLCTLLPWDSAFFGLPIARINGQHLDPTRAQAVLAWCAANGIRCLYFLAAADDPLTMQTAAEHGFAFVDARLTLSAAPAPASVSLEAVRPAIEADLPALIAIARTAHTDTRFFYDLRFDRAKAAELYARWIERDFREGDTLVVGETGAPDGYITCRYDPQSGDAQIGLVGVAESARGRGWGTLLVSAALDWAAHRRVKRMLVVTQGRNLSAQRLYARAGFLPQSFALWYHRWFG